MTPFERKARHRLTVEAAIERLQSLLFRLQRGEVSQIRSFQHRWEGPACCLSFSALGGTATDTIAVTLTEVSVSGELKGFALSLAKNQLESELGAQLDEALGERHASSEADA